MLRHQVMAKTSQQNSSQTKLLQEKEKLVSTLMGEVEMLKEE